MGKVRPYQEEAEDWCFNISIEKTHLLSAEKKNKVKKNSGKNLTLYSDDSIEEVQYSGSQELCEERNKQEKTSHVALMGTEFAKLSRALSDLIPDYLYDENQNCTLASHLEDKLNNLDNQCQRISMRITWNVLVSKVAHQEKANNSFSVSQKERVTLQAEISIAFS